VKITLLPSSVTNSGILPNQFLTTLLVNDAIAIDGGALGLYAGPAEQAKIRHVFLSHSHLDHWATMPIFLINVFGMAPEPVKLYASAAVLDSLRRDVFNGRVWPNLPEMDHEGRRFVDVETLSAGQAVAAAGMRITPIAVDHVVPTQGFIIEDETAAVVIASDTGATTEIWERASRTPNLKAVFLEATLPNDMAELAAATRHLTAGGFLAEMRKVAPPVRFFAVHLSARKRDTVIAELRASGLQNVAIAEPGRTYEF
jgi:ribonuclease BN (tRNA processing enzyme)